MRKTETKIIVAICVILFLMIMLFGAISNRNQETIVAITFDTEYHEDYTDAAAINESQWLYTIGELKNIAVRNNVKFQFNILGITAEKYPEVIKMLANSGQGISCHSYSHPDFTTTELKAMQEQVLKCKTVVSEVSGKEVVGNRFPYTKQNDDSFSAILGAGYLYDSSLLVSELGTNKPKYYKGILEIPVANAHDDWGYFIDQDNENATQFYKDFEDRIEPNNGVYVIILHPWVLAEDKTRLQELENFIIRLNNNGIKIQNLNEIYTQYS